MSSPPTPKLADQLSSAIRLRGYSYRTEQSYVRWYVRFVRFHKMRHPAEMGQPEVEAFLTHLVTDLEVSSSTQNQALAALLFLYAEVLKKPLGDVNALRAKKSHYVQPYLSADEVRRILDNLSGVSYLAACIMYGGGLRLMECLRLKDIDFAQGIITIHDAKGMKDRVTVLPDSLIAPLHEHLQRVKVLHDKDLARGYGSAPLPYALDRKYPNADREWGWQFAFPSAVTRFGTALPPIYSKTVTISGPSRNSSAIKT